MARTAAPDLAPTEVGTGLVLSTGRRMEQVTFDVAVVDFFAEAAGLLGVPKSVAAIYGIVFASAEPLSFANIEERLNISRGSISQGLRVLREVGAVREVSVAADRAELFAPDLEMRKLISRFVENRLQRQLDAGKIRLTALERAVPLGHAAEAKILQSRIRQLQSWHDRSRALLPLIRTFLKIT